MIGRQMKSWRRIARLAVAVLGIAAGAPAESVAAENDVAACGGFIRIENGRVLTGKPLTIADVTPDDTGAIAAEACLKAIATKVREHPLLSSVTISTRSGTGRAPAEESLRALGVVADGLVGAELPRSHIATAVHRSTPGQPDGVVDIAWRERSMLLAATQIFALSGPSWLLTASGARTDVGMGAVLMTGTRLETGNGATLRMRLIDGTIVRLGSATTLVALDSAMPAPDKRRIRLELVRGTLDIVSPAIDGPFEIRTAMGRAAGDPRRVRLSHGDDGVTRLQVLEGTMLFGGPAGDIFVGPGKGARVDFRGSADTPRALAVPPLPIEPLYGAMRPGELLSWDRVPEAESYLVDIARDPQFSRNWFQYEAKSDALALPDVMTQGRWYWRVTAVDVEGAQGIPSQIHGFDTP